jgi:hypothetical protein
MVAQRHGPGNCAVVIAVGLRTPPISPQTLDHPSPARLHRAASTSDGRSERLAARSPWDARRGSRPATRRAGPAIPIARHGLGERGGQMRPSSCLTSQQRNRRPQGRHRFRHGWPKEADCGRVDELLRPRSIRNGQHDSDSAAGCALVGSSRPSSRPGPPVLRHRRIPALRRVEVSAR